MTYEDKLCKAVETLGIHIEPGVDTSAQGEYAVYSYTSNGGLWGDDGPCIDHRHWLVIYVAPLGCDRLENRRQLRTTIFTLFDAWPDEDDYSDADGQRWSYEFETIGGIDDGSD